MFGVIQKSPLVQQHFKQQQQQEEKTISQIGPYEVKQGTGPLTRKRRRELMQEGTDLLTLSSPIPQKKGLFVCLLAELSFEVQTLDAKSL